MKNNTHQKHKKKENQVNYITKSIQVIITIKIIISYELTYKRTNLLQFLRPKKGEKVIFKLQQEQQKIIIF